MRAVIPVAGFGTRLKPHTFSLPKVLVNVGGKPILGHILDKLVEEKITDVTFIIGYLGEKIKVYVNTIYPQINAEYVEQKEMLGLGHAIHTAITTLNHEEIFIILGDMIFDADFRKFLQNPTSVLGVKEVDDASKYGVAILNEDGIIEKLVEKPSDPISNLALVGIYYIKDAKLLEDCLNELVEKDIRTKGELQLTDALQLLIDKGEKIKTSKIEGWFDCGNQETLLLTNKFLLSKNSVSTRRENVVIIPPVFIAENAKVENSVIGPNATISDNCEVLNSNIKNSIISSNAKVENSLLEDSLVGPYAVVKGKTKKVNIGESAEIEI
ncbi:MAG: NTP transferase domain-containing protein [Melioribacteraceae bacterium]|nr:NTP transferase domain-containing protein [Melioribacteraceae bacterium]